MISSNLPLVALLLLAGFLHTKAAIFESVIQEGSVASHQGNVVGQPKYSGSSDPLQQNKIGDLQCRLPFSDIGGRCLIVEIETNGPWAEMKVFCEQIGGQMLKMDSCNVMYGIVQYINDNGLPAHDYWIGCTDSETEGQFVHLDGTPMMMGTPFWDNVEPNGGTGENCVQMRYALRYFLNDENCGDSNNVICEQVD